MTTRALLLGLCGAMLCGACQFDTSHLDQLRADRGGPDGDGGLPDVTPDTPVDLDESDPDTGAGDVGTDADATPDATVDPDVVQEDPDVTTDLPVEDTPADVLVDQADLPSEDQGDAPPDAPDAVEEPDVAEPPNQPPVLVVPVSHRVEAERMSPIPGISVSDPDAGDGELAVTLTVSAGTLSLSLVPAGITFTNGDGVADPSMSFTGDLEAVNEAFEAVRFLADTPGVATLDVEVDDQGNTGSGGAQSDSDVVDLEIVERIYDFNVQRGTAVIEDDETSVTLDAGDDYEAPVGPAFVRIVNTRLTGMGDISGGGGQGANDWMVYVDDSLSIGTAIRFSRFGSSNDVRVTWELIEFTGEADSPNAIAVHAVDLLRWDSGLTNSVVGEAPAVAGVADDADVVVFVTGQASPAGGQGDAQTGVFTASWDGEDDIPVFRRLQSGQASRVSYAVVEFVGSNWSVQWLDHNYQIANGTPETEDLDDPVASLARTFIHVQHRSARGAVDELAAEVWLSDLDELSFLLQQGAATDQFAVVWVISNSQTTGDSLQATHYSGTRPNDNDGDEEDVWEQTIDEVPALERASIWGETARTSGTNTQQPRGSIDLRLISVDEVELRQSDAQETRNYHFSVVSWPDAD